MKNQEDVEDDEEDEVGDDEEYHGENNEWREKDRDIKIFGGPSGEPSQFASGSGDTSISLSHTTHPSSDAAAVFSVEVHFSNLFGKKMK
jgi:hypothetical protein